jgi:ApaG protein
MPDTCLFHCDVRPLYLPEQSSQEPPRHAFAYTVTITNSGTVAAQLIARHWVFEDESGHYQEVKGLGAVGQQPLLQPGESFEYTSGVQLHAPIGTMRGAFFCVGVNGERFEAPVNTLALIADGAEPVKRVLH